ncbi:hypothetical protein E2320_004326 [Naja naja]|nr:hypothetical protein E2320_004326 [Naja naja]
MRGGTELSFRAYYTLTDIEAKQKVIFANPNFLRDTGKFWKSKGIHAKRLSTGLFLVSAALDLCEEVTIYGFWPFSMDLRGKYISHHYYDNVLPDSGFHAMPEEFLQLWFLYKRGSYECSWSIVRRTLEVFALRGAPKRCVLRFAGACFIRHRHSEQTKKYW